MASLAVIQKQFPEAATVAGRVILHYQGKHYDLGAYVGDGAVLLSKEGEELLHPKEPEVKASKKAPALNLRPKGGLSLDNVEV